MEAWPGRITPAAPSTPSTPHTPLRRVASAPPSTPSPQRQQPAHAPAPAARPPDVDDASADRLELELLAQLPIGALRRRALFLGVGAALVEETIDTSDTPREDLIALLVRAQAQATRRATGELNPGPPWTSGATAPRAAATGDGYETGSSSRGRAVVRSRRRGSPARHPANAYDSPRHGGTIPHGGSSPCRLSAASPVRRLSAGGPVRRGRTAWDQVHVGVAMEEYEVVTLQVPRSEWQTEVVDVERTVMQSRAVPHAVARTRIVVRVPAKPHRAPILIPCAPADRSVSPGRSPVSSRARTWSAALRERCWRKSITR